MKHYIFLLFIFSGFCVFAQQPESRPVPDKEADSAKPTIDLYQIIDIKGDTTFVDTTLTIQKDYKFNYLRQDNFELLPFSNTGQTYNSLALQKDYQTALPEFGAQARHFNFMDAEDINYYHVATPWTQLYFKTVPEQGQQLDASFTSNLNPRLNLFVAYKGTRALGKYRHILVSTGNLRLGGSYRSKNGRYSMRTHFVSQDLLNEENGGLTPLAKEQYLAKEEEFEDRKILDVKFENAESVLFGKRFFLDQDFIFSRPGDTINQFKINHKFNYNYKKFQFSQDNAITELFGPSFESVNLRDETRLKHFFNELTVDLSNRTFGTLEASAGITNYEYGYNSVYVRSEDDIVGNQIRADIPHIGGYYQNRIGPFSIEGRGRLNLSSEFSGNFLYAAASLDIGNSNTFTFGFNQNSTRPNFNFLLYQSDYTNYNWETNFSNESTQRLFAEIKSEKILNASGELTQINNYTYFGLNEQSLISPYQFGGEVRFAKIKLEKEFDWGVFGSYNTVMYQNVLDGQDVLNLPDLTTRNSIYYKDFWFDKALYLQTGFTFNYFTSYNANAYDPILAEFYVQNEEEIGGFPVVDFFFNAKVDQARIFFKLQHLNAIAFGNNNFSAPDYPYTDFLIRFGLVWDFFL